MEFEPKQAQPDLSHALKAQAASKLAKLAARRSVIRRRISGSAAILFIGAWSALFGRAYADAGDSGSAITASTSVTSSGTVTSTGAGAGAESVDSSATTSFPSTDPTVVEQLQPVTSSQS